MTITRSELDTLTRRKAAQALQATFPVREGWEGGALTVFVPGRPRNPLNGSHEHWSKRAKWAKGWRERAANRLYEIAPRKQSSFQGRSIFWPGGAKSPKRVTFTIHGPARFDDDNVRAVCKPVRDALKDMAVIDDDRPSAGHTFVYEQAKPTRKAGATHGIAIRIELASAAPQARPPAR